MADSDTPRFDAEMRRLGPVDDTITGMALYGSDGFIAKIPNAKGHSKSLRIYLEVADPTTRTIGPAEATRGVEHYEEHGERARADPEYAKQHENMGRLLDIERSGNPIAVKILWKQAPEGDKGGAGK
jgi:hypothetical protein